MNIVQPYAKMLPSLAIHTMYQPTEFTLYDGIELLRRIEWCARISHRSEEAVTDNSYDRFLRSVVLQHGDWSVTEHVIVSVDFYMDRGITHEEVRHRIQAITQESTRFVNYEKKMAPSFIYPCSGNEVEGVVEKMDPDWQHVIQTCEDGYKKLIAKGWPPQRARSVFPNALGSRLIATMNLRSWRHFFLMRSTKEAHPQMRQVVNPLLKDFQRTIPILYEDIEPLAKQNENLKKAR